MGDATLFESLILPKPISDRVSWIADNEIKRTSATQSEDDKKADPFAADGAAEHGATQGQRDPPEHREGSIGEKEEGYRGEESMRGEEA